MAMLSICSIVSCKDQVHPTVKVIGQNERGPADYHFSIHKMCKCFSPSLVNETGRKWNVSHHFSELTLKGKRQKRVGVLCMVHNWSVPFQNSLEIHFPKVYNTNSHEKSSSGNVYQRDQSFYDSSESEACNTERQLKALDSYFSKLSDNMVEQLSSCISTSNSDTGSDEKECRKESSSQCEGKMTGMIEASGGSKNKTGLSSLKDYFAKLNTEIDARKSTPSIFDDEASTGNSVRPPGSAIGDCNEKENIIAKPDGKKHFESMDNQTDPGIFGKKNIGGLRTNDEASDLYLISLLAGINIAVFLFEIASPIRYSGVERLSLPLIYGAKINKLILLGEWWRLLTPMFLHSGFLHVALGCWVLLTFGPQVCRGYGPFTFFLIYILGGICGNLTSFIHTPELTVCGTGPVFAIIGAWLVYQMQNKEATDKDASVASESMFWKAVIATALSFVLSCFGRIDDWTHLGAVISGIIFGYFTCPGLELNDLSSKHGQKEGIALVQRKADPCKSLITFTISVLVLASLVFFYDPQVEMLELDGLVEERMGLDALLK